MPFQKIGLLGGTFDPPHYGHLLIANEVLEQCDLDEIWFVPASIPPHKQNEKISASKHRLAMLKMAIKNHPRFRLCAIEIEREGPSYTYETLERLVHQYEETQFFFIIGADMVQDLPNWKNIDHLLKLTTFIGVNRKGHPMESPYKEQIQFVEVPLFEVSSTFLRKRFREKDTTCYYLPKNVRHYIEENKLYE
ncbi:nicotinic acid mononucleotide adenylyltransferase [Pueribacillus theae]|uniref:Probable nicotinate-nucleotide adenylyltransferase n=1 Tax=Pueribacillus theae TaxID=2171751 RepID=A0A2U1K5H3_9BACI|nr:nicotinate-nucleotide adenylyltransferase [Pueribacillus theae]PWA12505.1 nicotinic acid mononucleotide adenylyltransferase [Pueribacillus theae]